MRYSKKFYRNMKNFFLRIFEREKAVSETSKARGSLAAFCRGNGLDIGYGGDPIVPHAICLDLPERYASYKRHPQHLHGDARDLHWFREDCLDYVYSSHLLEDFEDTKAVMSEWLRVIKTGGVLVLYLPDEQAYRKNCREKGVQPNVHHVHADFSLDYIKQILNHIDGVEIIHEKFPSGLYSFELVIKKCKKVNA